MPNNDFELPDDSPAREIAQHIVEVMTQRLGEAPDGGGCQAFYTRDEWRARGERYGLNADLIVVHEGGDASLYFSYDYGSVSAMTAMNFALAQMGYRAEPITSWCTGIYKDV